MTHLSRPANLSMQKAMSGSLVSTMPRKTMGSGYDTGAIVVLLCHPKWLPQDS